jgi:hypothetical protein
MNEVSAVEAVWLFHEARSHMIGGNMGISDFGGFATDVAARDFFECMEVFRRISAQFEYPEPDPFDEEQQEAARIITNVPEKDWEEFLSQFTPRQKEIVELLRKEPHLLIKHIGDRFTVKKPDGTSGPMSLGAVKGPLEKIYRLLAIHSKPALVAKIKEALPSKADKRPSEPKKQTPKSKHQS